jgi:hypothetical protein
MLSRSSTPAIVADDRGHFSFPAGSQVAEQRERQFASNSGKGISVEEKKWRATMTGAELIQRFGQGQRFEAEFFPIRCARC